MAEPLPAYLEASRRALAGSLAEKPIGCKIPQRHGRTQRVEYFLGIRLPVRRDSQHSLLAEAIRHELDEGTLQQSALVMTFLGPGVGKQNPDFTDRVRTYLLLQYLDGIVTGNADVRQLLLLEQPQKPAHTRTMDFDAEVVPLGVRGCEDREMVSVTEPYLDAAVRPTPKDGVQLEKFWFECNPVLGPERFEGAQLRIRDPSAAGNVRTDRTRMLTR